MKRAAWILVLVLLLTGCTPAPNQSITPPTNGPISVTVPAQPAPEELSGMSLHANTDELFSKRDYNATVSGGTIITLDGTAIRCTGSGVTVTGSTATITHRAGFWMLMAGQTR